MTSPPAHFTEGTLIAAMKNAASQVSDPKLKKVLRENAGLGTEATRAGVLEVLFARQYLEKSGKHIRSTQRGRELTAALPEALTSPGMTALWEQALDDIAQGRMSLDTFMGETAAVGASSGLIRAGTALQYDGSGDAAVPALSGADPAAKGKARAVPELSAVS